MINSVGRIGFARHLDAAALEMVSLHLGLVESADLIAE
jgi:hypothetical protein